MSVKKYEETLPVEELVEKAMKAMEMSYSPYSGFRVGACLLTSDGDYYTGCNIENAAYTPTNCAERTAFFKAVSEGKREFRAICIVNENVNGEHDFCAPCGVCRQVMMEFCDPESCAGKEQQRIQMLFIKRIAAAWIWTRQFKISKQSRGFR